MRPRPRRTAASDAIEPDAEQALQCFGLVAAELPEPLPELPERLEVCPDNQKAVHLFLSCQRYWRVSLGGMGGAYWSALDPSEVRQIMCWQNVPRQQQGALWQQYAVMEQEALSILNQRAATVPRTKKQAHA